MFKTLINIRSEYSFLNSLIKIKEYVDFAKKNKLSCLVMSDNNMHGVMEFYNLCIENNIKPIISINHVFEFSGKKFNLNLICKNYEGYLNLCKISSKLLENNVNDIKEFLVYLNDLIIIINIDQNVTLIQKFLSEFIKNDDLYFGIINSNENNILNSLAESKIIFNYEINYLNLDESNIFKCIQAIKLHKSFNEIVSSNLNHYFSVAEINNLNYLKYLNNIDSLLNKCDLIFKKLPINIFEFSIPEKISNFKYLKNICMINLSKMKLEDNLLKIYLDRLEDELLVIKNNSLVNYFLIVQDYVMFAKSKNIMIGPGRGSSASSLVVYLLGITLVDPIKYGLLFERFLNYNMIKIPDIDIDFEDDKRNQILDYLVNKYGKYNVATIVTFQSIGIKMALRDVGQALNINKDKIDNVCKKADYFIWDDFNIFLNKDNFLRKCYEENPEWFLYAKKIIGFPRQTSTHAAGIVISNSKLNEIVPIHLNNFGMMQIQYSMNHLEFFGLIKMDLLGLKNLTILNNILTLINKDNKNNFLTLESINLNDEKTFKLLREGNTQGIFQLESSGMIDVLQKINVNSFLDIVSTLSLYRPGTMKNIDIYIKNKSNPDNIQYLDLSFEKILSPTYGIIIFQEQIMLIAKTFASFTFSQADILRNSISKKNKIKLNSLKDLFFQQAKINKFSDELISDVWNLIYKFTEYGFNKSHAVSYSLITYWLAYLKTNYSTYFFAVIFNGLSFSSDRNKYFNEAQNFNIKLIAPSINIPILDFSAEKNKIFFPLTYVKGINNFFVLKLREELKKGMFNSYINFIHRMKKHEINLAYENLVYSGALDLFQINRTSLIKNYNLLSNVIIHNKNLEFMLTNFQNDYYEFELFPDDLIFIANMEYKYLGFYLKYDPIQILSKKNNISKQISKISDLKIIDYDYYIIAQIINIKKIIDKNNRNMAFITISDYSNEISAVIFSDVFEKNIQIININSWILFKIKLSKNNNKNKYQVIFCQKLV